VGHRQLSVVTRPDDQRVVGQAASVERIEHLQDFSVDLLVEVCVEARIFELTLFGPDVSESDGKELAEGRVHAGLGR
jgi:hypothetical protein